MRILLLHNFYQHPGGEDTVVRQEANELSNRGHDVRTLSTKNKKKLKGLIQYALYPFNFMATLVLLKKINAFKPDIIHIHNLHYAIGPSIIRKLKQEGYPVAMTLHNFRLICPSATLFYRGSLFTKSITENFPWTAVKERVLDHSFFKTLITAYTYWRHRKMGTWQSIDRYFTFSTFSKHIFTTSKLNINEEKFIIKPNFTYSSTPEVKIYEDYFVYIGRLSIEKGIIPFLEAFSTTNYVLKIFGEGPLQSEVENFTHSYPNIKYYGFQDKETLSKEIKSANALIVPSVCYEGMPMGIIEAFSLGTPVLCSNIGILKQMVVPLHTGLHFDPNSIDSITNCLNQWSALDKETKDTISINCANEFHKNYTATISMAILEEVYQQIIKENEHNNYRPT